MEKGRSMRPSGRDLMRQLAGPLIALAVFAGFVWLGRRGQETEDEKAERLANAPALACEALLRDSRRIDGDEELRDVDEHYTRGDLRYEEDLRERAIDELDGATDPDAKSILEYLEHDASASDALGQSGDLGVVEEMVPTGQRLRENAMEACANLGHPEWEEYDRQRESDR